MSAAGELEVTKARRFRAASIGDEHVDTGRPYAEGCYPAALIVVAHRPRKFIGRLWVEDAFGHSQGSKTSLRRS
jgi:hypothetical protein